MIGNMAVSLGQVLCLRPSLSEKGFLSHPSIPKEGLIGMSLCTRIIIIVLLSLWGSQNSDKRQRKIYDVAHQLKKQNS